MLPVPNVALRYIFIYQIVPLSSYVIFLYRLWAFLGHRPRIPSVCSLHLVPDNTCWFKISSRKHHSGSIGWRSLLSSISDKPNPVLALPLPCQGSVWILISYMFHSYICGSCFLVSIIQIYQILIYIFQSLTGGLERFIDKLELEKSLNFRICLALTGGTTGKNIDRIRDLMTPSSKTCESAQTAQIMWVIHYLALRILLKCDPQNASVQSNFAF